MVGSLDKLHGYRLLQDDVTVRNNFGLVSGSHTALQLPCKWSRWVGISYHRHTASFPPFSTGGGTGASYVYCNLIKEALLAGVGQTQFNSLVSTTIFPLLANKKCELHAQTCMVAIRLRYRAAWEFLRWGFWKIRKPLIGLWPLAVSIAISLSLIPVPSHEQSHSSVTVYTRDGCTVCKNLAMVQCTLSQWTA